MLRPAKILIREISACGKALTGAATARSKPSTRMRTTRPLRNGSIWISLARSSMAFSSMSLTARTTGAPLARSRRLSMSSSARAARRAALPGRRFLAAKLLAENGRDILEGRDLDRHGSAKDDFGGVDSGGVARVGDGKPIVTLSEDSKGKTAVSRKKARRKAGGQRGRGDELRQREPLQAVKSRHFIGEPIGREFRRFPQFAKRPVRAVRLQDNRLGSSRGQKIFVCQKFREIFNGNLSHCISEPIKPCHNIPGLNRGAATPRQARRYDVAVGLSSHFGGPLRPARGRKLPSHDSAA